MFGVDSFGSCTNAKSYSEYTVISDKVGSGSFGDIYIAVNGDN